MSDHSKIPWRWGEYHCVHPKEGKSYWEFRPEGDTDHGLVLCYCEYGHKSYNYPKDTCYVMNSDCTGYGGETDIDISYEDQIFILKAVNSHDKLVKLTECYAETLELLSAPGIPECKSNRAAFVAINKLLAELKE